MIRKKYTRDYQTETVLSGRGGRKTVTKYVGAYYRFSAAPETVARMKVFYTVLTALAAVFWVLLLLPNVRTETHSWAYIAPMVLGLLAVAYELMALWRLLTAGQRVTREHSDKIFGRIQFVSVAHTVLALCALAGAVVMLCTNPFSNRNLLLLCGAFLWAACGAAMFLLRGNLRMEECPAEQ